MVHVAVPHMQGYEEDTALPSVTEQSGAHWLLDDVHFCPEVHVADPQKHGYEDANAVPSVVEHAGAH